MFNFFKKFFARKQKTKALPKHSYKKQQYQIKSEIDKLDSKIAVIETKTEITAKTPATVLVKFLNNEDVELKPNLIFKSYLGDPLKLVLPQIDGYIFKKIDGISSLIVETEQTIIVRYQKELGQPVMIYCFDYDNNQLLRVPKFSTGTLGSKYQIQLPKIDDYQPHFSIGNLSGFYTREAKNIVLYYRRKDWKIVQPVNYLISVKSPATVYNHPSEQESYDFTLPINSVWKVFKEVKTNNQIWLSLGGAEWIKQEYTTRIDPYQKQID